MDASNSSKSSDYGVEESRGTVVRLAVYEITIRHQDSVLGAIAVHFPHAGYRIAKQ